MLQCVPSYPESRLRLLVGPFRRSIFSNCMSSHVE